MTFPDPVIAMAVEPKTKSDQEKMGIALSRLAQEDPSFRVRSDEESGQTIIAGMGELHLEILVDRMKREFNVEANVGKPQVAYRETIRKAAVDVEGKHVKQSGGKGQYGHVVITMEPQERGKGYEFENKTVGGTVPKEYVPAVDKGIREAMTSGPMAGYPVVDIKIKLVDGSYHEVDSNEMAFKIAASMGFKNAVEKARPVLLEPIMNMEIAVPDECMGDVIGDLNSRRGKVLGMDTKGHTQVIKARVPMSEVLKYAPDLRSITSGRGEFQMEFAHYEELPAHLAEKVIKEAKASKAAEHNGEKA